MRAISILRPVLVAFALCAGSATIAFAQQPAAADAQPQTLPANPLPGVPAAAPQAAAPALPADLQTCLQETGDYVTRGKVVVYVIGITNTCAKRLRCEIYANVSGAKGSSLGHTVMLLGASGSGAAAKQTFTMRVKSAGGLTQVSRECKAM